MFSNIRGYRILDRQTQRHISDIYIQEYANNLRILGLGYWVIKTINLFKYKLTILYIYYRHCETSTRYTPFGGGVEIVMTI